MKKLRSSFRKFFKDKWNIAISVLILIVTILGIAVVGLLKTVLVAAIVVGLVLFAKYGTGLFIRKPKKKHEKHEKRSHERKSRKKLGKLANALFIVALCSGIIIILGGIAFMGYIVVSAPKFDTKKLLYKEASILYDINGKEITRIGKEMRDKVTYDEIPQVFVDAIIATEDSRFFEHNGFDLPRFIKASAGQVLGNSSAGGASTISMQVIKNNFTSVNKSITRKFTDIYMAVFKLEKEYTKEEILEFYVNDIHLGVNNSFGIAETSRVLFGKEIGDINLSQAALLAGMFQAPGAYNPYRFPEKAAARRHTVLYLMNLHGYITNEQMRIADSMPIESIIAKQAGSTEPYQNYIDYVAQEVEDKTGYDPMVVPMRIYTNLDTKRQDYINDILSGKTYTWENDLVQAGIAVVDVDSGAILALGGGRNNHMEAKTVNLASDLTKQVGSTAKPLFDYGPGMEFNNWSTYTPFVDDVYSYTNGPELHDWDNKYEGMLTLRYALTESRNIPALKAFQQVDNKKIIDFVQSLGITPEIESGHIHEAHAIGGFNGSSPLQLAAAYAAFANGGYYIKPYAVNKVELIDSGESKNYKSEKKRVMSDSTAYMITNVLKYGVDNKIIGGGKVNGIEVAAKSGTSNFDEATKERYHMTGNAVNDLWYAGYSPDTAIGLWYGYEKTSSEHYSTTPRTSGIRDRLFTQLVNGIFDKNGHTFNVPSSVVQVKVEKDTIPAMLPSKNTPSSMITTEYFKKGTEPTEVSPRFDTLSNITGLDAEKSGNSVILSWNAASVPNMITEEYLNAISAQRDKYINIHNSEDNRFLGTLGYNIYLKNNDGSLKFLGWTSNTNYTHTPNSSGTLTYVVKTCYSILKSSESTGSTFTLSDNPYISPPTANLSTNSITGITYTESGSIATVKVGTTYVDAGFKVLRDAAEVTGATVSITVTNITNTASPIVISTSLDSISKIHIDTSVANIKYRIDYVVTYAGDVVDTLRRTVIIE